MSTPETIIVNGAAGLTMAQAAAAWPCSERTFLRLRKLRGSDGQPILRTYPMLPDSPVRITSYADIQAARERIAAMEAATLDDAITQLGCADDPPVETVAEEIARLEREQRAASHQRRKSLGRWASE